MNSPKQLSNYLKEYFVTKLGNNTIKGSLFAGGSGLSIGSVSIPFTDLYVTNLHASFVSGTLTGTEWEGPGNLTIDANSASNTTVYIVNQGAGLASLSVENNLTVGGLINGIDLVAHVANVDAHHNKSHVLATTAGLGTDHTVSGLTTGYVLRASSATTAAFAQLAFTDMSGTISNAQGPQFLLLDGSRTMTGPFISDPGNSLFAGVGIGATNTGFFKGATNTINITIGASEKGRFTSTGLRLGGATDPTEVLDITGNILASGNLTIGSDTDIITTLGRGKFGYIAAGTDVLNIAHFDMFTTTSYALKQDNAGNTTVNAANTKTLNLSVNNSALVGITTTIRTFANLGVNKAPSVALDVSGAIAGDSTLTLTSTITAASDMDSTHVIGRGKIFSGFSDSAMFAHFDHATSTNYGFRQASTGDAVVNAPTGQIVHIRNNNNDITTFSVNGINLTSGLYIQSANYTSGWAGAGWRADNNLSVSGQSFAEFDNLSIRGTMTVYELIINQIRATNGSLFVTAAGKIDSISGSDWTMEDPKASGLCPFAVNDLVIIQEVNMDSSTIVKRIVRRVTAVTGKTITVTAATGGPTDVGTVAVGDDVIRFGSSSNAARQGTVMLTSDMSNSPYMDIISGVTSWADWTGGTKTKLRIGLLSGLSIGSANEYGFAASYDGFGSTNSWVKISTAGAQFNNIPIQSYNGANQTFNLSSTGTDFWIGVSSGDKRITWNGTTLAINGTITANAGAIGGWTIASGLLSSTGIGLDSANSKIYIGASTTFGTDGAQFERNAGNPRMYIGDGASQYFKFDGTSITWSAANTSLDASGNLTATSATLSGAITATSGSITGFLTIGSSGGIYQGSGTSGTPTTGLKIWNVSGVGKIGGYNTGTLQWYGDTDGKFYFGGGNVVADSTGLTFPQSTSVYIRHGTGATETTRYSANENGSFGGSGEYKINTRYTTSANGWEYATNELMVSNNSWGARAYLGLWTDVLNRTYAYSTARLYIGAKLAHVTSGVPPVYDPLNNIGSVVAQTTTTASSISLNHGSWGNASHIGFNAYFVNNSIAYNASGAWKYFGGQYTGNVTAPGLLTFDANANSFRFQIGETGLATEADITTWDLAMQITRTSILVTPDTDSLHTLGRAKIGYLGSSDNAAFSHYDNGSATNYALLQSAAGKTYLNAAIAQTINFRINNSDVMMMNNVGLRIGDSSSTTHTLELVTSSFGSGADVILELERQITTTPAIGMGVSIQAVMQSSTTQARDAGRIGWKWDVVTDASRATHGFLSSNYITTENTSIEWGSNSTGATLGFYGATRQNKQTVTGSRGGNAALASVLTALANLGLITNSSTA